MKQRADNKILSSFALYLDHFVQEEGEAYVEATGRFYPINTRYNGLYAYACPYRQLCNDVSVSGANVMSGVHINGTFIEPGESGLFGIDHYRGIAYFDAPLSASAQVTGSFSVKDFGIEITDRPEEQLLFGTKYFVNGTQEAIKSGLAEGAQTAPIIYIRPTNSELEPFCFGGVYMNSQNVRLVVVADNQFKLVAVCDILKGLKYKTFEVYDELPFMANTRINTGQLYSYDDLSVNSGYAPLILDAKVINITPKGEFEKLRLNIAFVDLNISTSRL